MRDEPLTNLPLEVRQKAMVWQFWDINRQVRDLGVLAKAAFRATWLFRKCSRLVRP